MQEKTSKASIILPILFLGCALPPRQMALQHEAIAAKSSVKTFRKELDDCLGKLGNTKKILLSETSKTNFGIVIVPDSHDPKVIKSLVYFPSDSGIPDTTTSSCISSAEKHVVESLKTHLPKFLYSADYLRAKNHLACCGTLFPELGAKCFLEEGQSRFGAHEQGKPACSWNAQGTGQPQFSR